MSHKQDEREEAADGVDDEAVGLQCCPVGCHEVDDDATVASAVRAARIRVSSGGRCAPLALLRVPSGVRRSQSVALVGERS